MTIFEDYIDSDLDISCIYPKFIYSLNPEFDNYIVGPLAITKRRTLIQCTSAYIEYNEQIIFGFVPFRERFGEFRLKVSKGVTHG